jgi:HlyD family secretion protein
MADAKPSLNDLRIERKPEAAAGAGKWIVLLVLVVLAGCGAWFFLSPRAIEVRTVNAREMGSAADHTVLNASGYVTARRQATVSSKITGKVVEVLIEEGMKVKEGQLLARLDDTNVRAALRLSEAQLHSAQTGLNETQARLKEARLTLRRTADLAKSNISAQADLDHAEAEVSALEAHRGRKTGCLLAAATG